MIKRVQIIDLREFVVAALNPIKQAFIVHVAYLDANILRHPVWKAQIASLIAKKVTVLTKY